MRWHLAYKATNAGALRGPTKFELKTKSGNRQKNLNYTLILLQCRSGFREPFATDALHPADAHTLPSEPMLPVMRTAASQAASRCIQHTLTDRSQAKPPESLYTQLEAPKQGGSTTERYATRSGKQNCAHRREV